MCGVMWLHACMRRPGCKLIFCGVASKTNNVPVVRHKVPMDPVTIRIEVISSKSSQGFDGKFDDNLDGLTREAQCWSI